MARQHCFYNIIFVIRFTTNIKTRGDNIIIERDVRLRNPLSLKLFTPVLENIFRKLDWSNTSILTEKCFLNHLRIADVIFVETSKDLEEQESTTVDLEINMNKTKIMTNFHKGPIKIKENNIEYFKNYIDLRKRLSC